MADAEDSKSSEGNLMRVRIPPPAFNSAVPTWRVETAELKWGRVSSAQSRGAGYPLFVDGGGLPCSVDGYTQ